MITVHNLKRYTQGTTYANIQKHLTGLIKLIVAEDSAFQRGTYIIEDTQAQIMCHFNMTHPILINMRVIMKHWNYIHQAEFGVEFIECMFADIYDEFNRPLTDFLEADMRSLAQQDIQFHQPDRSLMELYEHQINLVGRVKAISPFQDSFLVELTDESENGYTTVVLNGHDMTRYYHMFQTDKWYAWTNIELVEGDIEIGAHKYLLHGFRFTHQSTVHYISDKSSFALLSDIGSQQEHVHGPWSTIKNQYTTHYQGVVTRVIDILLGVYELNSQLIVCLFHHVGYSPTQPYRINTRIKLSHLHPVSIEYGTSYLMNAWRAPKIPSRTHTEYAILLIGCVKTHVEVLFFPATCELDPICPSWLVLRDKWNYLQQSIYIQICHDQPQLEAFLKSLELYYTLHSLFYDTSLTYQQLLQAYFTINPVQPNCEDTISHFIQHHLSCHALDYAEYHQKGIYSHAIPTFLSISNIQKKASFVDHHPDIPGSHTLFEIEDIHIKKSKGLLPALCMIQVLNNGRLYLLDNSTQIPLQLIGADIMIGKDTLYLIQKLELFQENLSYLNGKEGKENLTCTYAVVMSQDIVPLVQTDTLSFTINMDFALLIYASSFITQTSLPAEKRYYVVYIIMTFPTSICFDDNGTVYLESRMNVRIYHLNSKSPPFETMLVLSSRSQTLHYLYYLQLGHWCIMTQMARKPLLSSATTSCFLEKDVYQIVPISNKASQSIVIVPTIRPDTILMNKTNMVFEISQLRLDITRLVDVKGIVVTKRFIEGFPRESLIHGHAKQLYKKFGIGTGRPYRKLFIRLRQLNTLHFVDIYMSVNQTHYPFGLIPGAMVTIRHLSPKLKRSSATNMYLISNDEATVEVHQINPSAETFMSQFPVQSIFSLFDITDDKMIKLISDIRTVIDLSFQWQCQDCSSAIRGGTCTNDCKNATRVFIARAFVQISDGTGFAYANIEGERLVFRMLRITATDILKESVMEEGPILYSDYKPDHEYVSSIIHQAKKAGPICLYAYIILAPEPDDWMSMLKVKKETIFDHGNQLDTLEFISVKLRVVEVDYIDPLVVAWNLVELQ